MKHEATYTGTWTTRDGYIKQQLLPGGRYGETRGGNINMSTGCYEIKGGRIIYYNDAGFEANGDLRHGLLYHNGHVFYREVPAAEKTFLE